jgi:hypothetical protein
MDLLTAETTLVEINTALTTIQAPGDIYTVNGVEYGFDDLATLAQLKIQYTQHIAALKCIEQCEAAIDAVVNQGQGYSFSTPSGNRVVNRANIGDIYKRLDDCRRKAAQTDPETNPNQEPVERWAVAQITEDYL